MNEPGNEGKVDRPLEGTCVKCDIVFAKCTMEETKRGLVCRRCLQRGDR